MPLKNSVNDALTAASNARKAADAADRGDRDAADEVVMTALPRIPQIDWSTAGLQKGMSRGTVLGSLNDMAEPFEDKETVRREEDALSAAINAVQKAVQEVADALESGDADRIKAASAKAREAGAAAEKEALRVDGLLKDKKSGLADADQNVSEWWNRKQADAKEAYDSEGQPEKEIHANMTNNAAEREKGGGGSLGEAVSGVLGAGGKMGRKG
ncbi:hypothetical protein AB0H82_04395 [Streptomyces sp. NPDC050732]|uniref:hypothetical protein n=1 Tax=Streptomyces sp. NPDC050732 TaxID=3154632 RepID=UPI00341D5DC1